MRILVVGEGGREHALVWAISKSSRVKQIICAPGNPGIAELAECVAVDSGDVAGLVALADRTNPDLVVVGPEAPLVAGLADALDEKVRVFGPRAGGAQLEGSKSFAKRLLKKKGIPTAEVAEFDNAAQAIEYVERMGGPVVVKADGLAAGKGVTVCEEPAQAIEAINEAMVKRRFGGAGAKVLIEERMQGPELSILAFVDGKSVLAMEPAQDFKRAFNGNAGPNTGGMGSYSPVPIATESVREEAVTRVLEPIAAALQEEGENYVGMIYAGLMLTEEGLKVIEFNCRFGDPEAQAILPRLNSDLAEVMVASVEGCLPSVRLDWRPEACVCVVAASGGYPGDYETGVPITGLEQANALENVVVFHAGTAGRDGRVVTAGGRVLAVSALGADQKAARALAYEAMAKISFPGMHVRSDIAEYF